MKVRNFVSLLIIGFHHHLMIWLDHWTNICCLGDSFVNDQQSMKELALICMQYCSAGLVPRQEAEECQETETCMCATAKIIS